MKQLPEVERARCLFGHRVDENPHTRWFDLDVFIELYGGVALDWYFEVSWEDDLLIESSVHKHDGIADGSREILSFPKRQISDFSEGARSMLDAATELLNTCAQFDLPHEAKSSTPQEI